MPVCPVCNRLIAVQKYCPRCGRLRSDGGVIQDYYDNYSAYLDQDIYEDEHSKGGGGRCVHLFFCPQCYFDTRFCFERLA